MTRSVFGHLAAIALASSLAVIALAASLMVIVSVTMGRAADCPQTIEQAAELFSGPGDRFGTGEVTDAGPVRVLILALGGSPDIAADHSARTATVAIGAASQSPPGIVTLGFFDASGCVVGGVSGVPIAVVARFLGAYTFVPRPSGPSI